MGSRGPGKNSWSDGDVEAHWELRRIIIRAGGRLESPSMEFRQDADSRMVENVLAGAAMHQREKNAEQTYNRMRARLINGYWVFARPRGYRYEKSAGEGNVLVRDEPLASIVQEALEGFASGRFETQVEVKRFLEAQPLFPKDLRNEVQIILTALSHDQVHHLDILGIVGASVALTISNVPWQGPVAAVRVGLIDGELVINPTIPQMEDSLLDLRVAGTESAARKSSTPSPSLAPQMPYSCCTETALTPQSSSAWAARA